MRKTHAIIAKRVSSESGGESNTITQNQSETPSSEVIESINNAVTTIVSEIVKIFSNLPTDVRSEIKTFSDSNSTSKTSEITNDEVSAVIPSNQKGLVVLDTKTVNTNGIYTFTIPASSLTGLATGTKIFIYMIVDNGNSANLGAVKLATATDAKTAVLVDDKGNVIDSVPASGNVNVAAYMEKDTEYTPVVTQEADNTTPTDDTKNNVENDNNKGLSSSGAGCDVSGLGIFGLFVLASALKAKK